MNEIVQKEILVEEVLSLTEEEADLVLRLLAAKGAVNNEGSD